MRFIFYILIFVLLIFTRFYNIEKTSRFIWDESSDLVSINRIWKEKDITLIGPISEDGNKVFGSLTYYLLLPFAVIFNFNPVSTTIGASFWGIITSILFLFIIYKLKGKLEILPTLLVIFWNILLVYSRWAWNPNFMLLWSSLSILILLSNLKYRHLLSGILIGLTIHHHYLGFYTALGLGIVLLYEPIKTKKFKTSILFAAGVLLTLSPFILFDLTHKPGLFLTRILYFNYVNTDGNWFNKLNPANMLFLFNLLIIFIYDVKNKSASLKYLFVFLFSSFIILLTTEFYYHYLLASIPFLFTYLVYKRSGMANFFAKALILIIVITSVYKAPVVLSNVTWENDIKTTSKIADVIKDEIYKNDLKNVNIAVLQSPDPNTYGRRYRDLLLIDEIRILDKGQYEITDNLFVISYNSVDEVKNDPSYEIKNFNKGKVVNTWEFENSSWKLYLLNRN